ncbi:conserved hypothetical protein [Culex quinquefasciatus]|uniref:Protein MIS12 homolog n=1 Tax=Culex quinquefasciatus TaxID=7176 RepID=B0W5D3_CULQU|nr:uncharacterized protein LOC120417475 [Culex pipiens pallens]EDS35253.1 conserved hypothetical protein [Culex quinquefasciatus]|eukprot:XP_001843921.1 conserved hypothetical protein [Culex quinquefasciatus]
MSAEEVEYQLQHFSFCAEDMIVENREMVKHLIQLSLLEFTDEYVKCHKIADEPAMALRAQCYVTANTMFSECTAKLDQLDKLFRTTLHIPANVLLPSDLLHKKKYTAEQVTALEDKVAELDKQFRRDGIFLAMLQDEIEVHDRLADCIGSEQKLMELAEQYRREDIVPEEDVALVDDLAEVMQDVLRS